MRYLFGVFILVLLSACSREQKADLVLMNARIWTVNPSQPETEALAVQHGKIAAIDSTAEIKKWIGKDTRVIDAAGRRVLPGFTDAHTHFLAGGRTLLTIDLRDCKDEGEFLNRLKAYADKLPAGRWITGGNWDHERTFAGVLPTRQLIDKVTPAHPVAISRTDGHMLLANSLALKLAKITIDTQSPEGGVIVKDRKTGEPTGILKDAAMNLVYRVMPDPTPEEMDEALAAAMKHAAQVGVTSIHDMLGWDHWFVYKRARDKGRLTVRVRAYFPISTWERVVTLRDTVKSDEWLQIGGLKGFVDGSLGSSTALMFAPFADDSTNSGTYVSDWFPVGIMKKRVHAADSAGLQVVVHAIGDRANAEMLDIYEQVEKENGPKDRRFRIEHAQHLRPKDIPRFKALGVIPSMQPYHCIDDGRWAEKRLGAERSKTTYAFRALLDAGANLSFGSDWDVAPLDPLLGIYAAVTRRTLDDVHPEGWIPEQKISVAEAVRCYTLNNAYAEFAENEKGSLEIGKWADFVMLSDDIFAIDPVQIRDVKVVMTVVGGKVMWEGGDK
ncbi:MAG: amidohydrolase [candidate division KSB1 bacterium]|nr:amidohydrolase [candidate division KSB1 bacterium]MDZ7301125.1 amidohydrolase [candidate division KSB1 bacterium]MDZ7311991.1 amidohydrolase [candidate division KSB1 bacterium]